MSLIDDKRTLRSAMLAWRGALSDDERRAAASGLLATWQRELPFETPAVVSGFWPIRRDRYPPLMIELFNGAASALPVVQAGPVALNRAWRLAIAEEGFGTLRPARRETEPDGAGPPAGL
jgi:5-formyltetrahydrofolate cyclo-ligase